MGHLINLDEYPDIGTHWIALYISNNGATLFDSFGLEHIPKEIKKSIGNKNMQANIFKIQPNNSIMCGYFCIGVIDFKLTRKALIDYTSLFLRYYFEKNDSIILSYFKNE